MGRHVKPILGRKFGKLTAVEFKGTNADHKALWLFQCDCGKLKVLNASNVRNGLTVSCGCALRDYNRSRRTYGDEHYERNRDVRVYF